MFAIIILSVESTVIHARSSIECHVLEDVNDSTVIYSKQQGISLVARESQRPSLKISNPVAQSTVFVSIGDVLLCVCNRFHHLHVGTKPSDGVIFAFGFDCHVRVVGWAILFHVILENKIS